jgi:hypothetical protein
VTPADFAKALLSRLGLPVTDNNVAALVAFQAQEGGHMHNAAAFNPMNTTWKMPGSSLGSGLSKSIGVQAYSNWDQGIEATAKTLSNGLYSDIISALRRSAPPDETLRAVGASKWGCTICGKTPASLLQSYGSQLFPGGGGLFDTGERAIKELFTPSPRTLKIGAGVALSALAIGGVVLIVYFAKNKREARAS